LKAATYERGVEVLFYKVAAEDLILTEFQVAAIKRKKDDDEACVR